MKKMDKKVLIVCSLLSAGIANAQDAPVAMYYSDYTGDSFVANWDLVGEGSNTRLSVFETGENVLVKENFRGINSTDGKIDQSNPNYPAGWVVSVSDFGKADIAYDGKSNRLMLDADGDYVSTTLIVGSNLKDFTINANLVNAEGITKENSSIFKIDYYDCDGLRIAGGQIEALYFASQQSLNMKDALSSQPVDVGTVKISLVTEGDRKVGALLLESLSYTYDKPLYVMEQHAVEGLSHKVDNLDVEKKYWYYVQGEKDGKLSAVSNIIKVDGFLTPTATKATSVSKTAYTANWERLPKATGYLVQNYQFVRVQEDGDMPVVSESFSKATEGSVESPVRVTNPDDITDNPGWTGNNIIMAPGMMGASAGRFPMNLSYVHSPKMNLAGQGGKYKISIKARGKAGNYLSVYRVGYLIDTDGDGNPDNVNIHKTVPFNESGILEDTWEMTDGADGMTLSFEESKMQQFLIEEVTISQEVKAGTVMTFLGELAEINDGNVTSCVFKDLKEGYEYGYDVVGVRTNDYEQKEQSNPSEIVRVQNAGSVEELPIADDVQVLVSGKTVTVTLKDYSLIELYNIEGRLVESVSGVAGQSSLSVPYAGVYLLKVGNSVFKLIVR